jgi:hypothetical protein
MEQESKNKKLLAEFTTFCEEHPELRFWQALNAWAELPNLVVMNVEGKTARDTFYWENKNN